VAHSVFRLPRTGSLGAGRRESSGNVLAAMFGVATPFCSCSAVPLFIGFVAAGAIESRGGAEVPLTWSERIGAGLDAVREIVGKVWIYVLLGIAVEVIKDESVERMMALGLLATPGLAVDSKVILSGRIPKADEVRRLLGRSVTQTRATSQRLRACSRSSCRSSRSSHPTERRTRPGVTPSARCSSSDRPL
jgi:hypothetical protein